MRPFTYLIYAFAFILILLISGLSVNLNRLLDLAISHEEVEEKWGELQDLGKFQIHINDLISYFSFHQILQSPSVPTLLGQIKFLQNNLNLVTTTLSVHQTQLNIPHQLSLRRKEIILNKIQSAFEQITNQILSISTQVNFKWDIQLIDQNLKILRTVQANTIDLQTICVQEMKQALIDADQNRKSIIEQTITISFVIIILVIFISLVVTITLTQQTRKLMEHDQLATIGSLTQSLMHEIRNPLGIIKSSASVLSKNLHDRKTEQELSEYLIEEVDRIDDLLNQLLNLVRNDKLITQKELITDIIQQVIKFLEPETTKNGIQVEFQNNAKDTLVPCNKNQIKQALINLILNSLRACSQGERIVVRCSIEFNHCVITIQDFGIGMDKTQLAQIFNPFYTTREKGFGLGLSIVKRIIDKHHGHIHVHSRINLGTTFKIHLPLKET